MTRRSALPITFAGFPAYDDAEAGDAQIAIIGVPYLSPYPVEKSYDSQNAVSTIPVLRAYEDVEDLCVVQIDAHLDWVDERDGVSEGFSSPMRRASEMPYVSSVVQIGLRGQGSARQKEVDDATACSKSLLIKAEDLHEQGVHKVLKRIPDVPYYYLTVDADGLDPAIAPGVAYPTPGGVTYFQLFNLMRGLARKGSLMGMDFVEVVPENDIANITSLFAARQILNFMGVVAHSRQFSER